MNEEQQQPRRQGEQQDPQQGQVEEGGAAVEGPEEQLVVPLAVYVLLRNMVFQEEGQENLTRIILAVGLVIFQLGGWALSAFGAQVRLARYWWMF